MGGNMTLAPDYPRNEDGWIQFPEDHELRKLYFPPEVMGHPAKANLHMIQSIVEFVSEPGQTILDPMSGTGTLLIAATMGRGVIEEGYHKLQREAAEVFGSLSPGFSGALCLLLHGDCRKLMPLPCDHIIFSPPYAGVLQMSSKPKKESTRSLAGPYKDTIQEYSQTQGNVGKVNAFIYSQIMEKVYGLCFESLRAGGTMTVILQDYYGFKYGERKRIFLSDWLLKTCIRLGFEQLAWSKRYARGTGFKQLWASRGLEVVTDEDIVTFGKPEVSHA